MRLYHQGTDTLGSCIRDWLEESTVRMSGPPSQSNVPEVKETRRVDMALYCEPLFFQIALLSKPKFEILPIYLDDENDRKAHSDLATEANLMKLVGVHENVIRLLGLCTKNGIHDSQKKPCPNSLSRPLAHCHGIRRVWQSSRLFAR